MTARKKKKTKNTNRAGEIVGIILIGLAIFIAITVYLNVQSVFGTFIQNIVFGLGGIIGYAIPIILVVVGILMIAARKKTKNTGKLVLFAVTILFIFSLMHVSTAEAVYQTNGSYLDFIKKSYDVGMMDATGGGAIGSLLSYWTFQFLGLVGSYIVFIVGIIAFVLVLANLSIKKVSKEIGSVVKTTYDEYRVRAEERREQKKLYVENLDQEKEEQFILAQNDEFNMRIEDIPTNLPSEMVEKDEYAFEEDGYNPAQYRKVFSDTDIIFDDEQTHEVKGKRKIEQTAPVPTIPATAKSVPLTKPKYIKPPLNLLNQMQRGARTSASDLRRNVDILENTLASFNVSAKVVNVSHGPVVTRYEIQPAPGVKVSKIVNLSDDIAMNLSARDVRIEAPVPGKPVVGIEIPNAETSAVGLKDLVASEEFKNQKSPVAFALGKDIGGTNVYADIAKMPHLLIAGATGSGKSVCINSLIVSILYHSTPEDVKMIMIDPKVVELNIFNDIPHLLIPVVTDPKKASSAINWAVNEMTMRYRMFAAKGAKDIARYNKIMEEQEKEKLPKILVIIDELADLMMVAPGEVEDAICRIAQLGRASGIHLIIATQRPSVDVITGIIKANIPSRIAFSVSSQIDSRTILDMGGAEKLLGQGDMLYYPTGAPKPVRLQGCFISDKEVEAVANFLKDRTESEYDARVMEGISKQSTNPIAGQDEKDELFVKALEIIIEYDQASTSMLQRRLRIGYARAARLIDQLEENGFVSPMDGSKPRQVLITKEEFDKIVNPQQQEEVEE
ncbi:MAG: DNA translocase FtsK [Christensenellaceae bacterium]